ncbi:MAG: DedA family protein [Magnetococcus sp. DMHC-6]
MIQNAGLTGLFLSSFLAATLLPISSEVVLLALMQSEAYSDLSLWISATTGNVMGSQLNWLLGRYCLRYQDHKWFPFKKENFAKTRQRFLRYGLGSLLLAWLPIIGDPLTFMAGVLRVPFGLFTLLVFLGKGGRYLLLLTWSFT